MNLPSRCIEKHVARGVASTLTVTSVGEENRAGARNRYEITGFQPLQNPLADPKRLASLNMLREGAEAGNPEMKLELARVMGQQEPLVILFQHGNPGTEGVNGITMESLLAVVIDRLEGFQAGPYACEENRQAMNKIQRGLTLLQRRQLKLAGLPPAVEDVQGTDE